MARFAFLLPREEMVHQADAIAAELGMEVVLSKLAHTAELVYDAEAARALGADIIVARGRQASILKRDTSLPIVEIKLTGQEVALLLSRARKLVPDLARPRIGVVTVPNMIGDIHRFDEVLDIELHTYFVSGIDEMGVGAQRAIDDGMDVILGGDFVNGYCREKGQLTLFWDSTEDSIRTSLRNARSVGFAADAERKNTAHLQTLLDYSFSGILELDPQGVVVRANDVACKILDLERGALLGASLGSLMPEEDAQLWAEALEQRRELYFSVLNIAGVHVVVNAAPVVAWDAAEGLVFSFYEMRKIERQGERALRERYRLHRYLAHGRFEDVSRSSREMQRTVKLALTFAETLQPILLQGEVGSGKSLFAQSIHNSSPCVKGPFVTFDCGANWGDQANALANAAKDADMGTLYLDAVDQLSRAGQHVLRRLIEDGVVHRREDETPLPVRVRVIASLAGDLARSMAEGAFQPELYYMLAPMRVSLPPLRTRPEDLDRAIDMCLDDCVTRLDRYIVLTKEARRILLDYPWPGNYTQLRTFRERITLTAPSRTVNDGYVRQLLRELYPALPVDGQSAGPEAQRQPEAVILAEALSRCNGSRAAAAAELGISKTTLWRRMKKYGVRDRYEG